MEILKKTYRAINLSARAVQVKSTSAEVNYDKSVRTTSCNSSLVVITEINTGFGGSADTRTEAVDKLKKNSLSGLQYGIVTEANTTIADLDYDDDHKEGSLPTLTIPLNHETNTVMPGKR